MNSNYVALAPFLRSCPFVVTLGVRACIDEYSREEKELLMRADRIFYPTRRFMDVFEAINRPTFPAPTTTRYLRSRMQQQLLLQYASIPHPRGRIYHGARHKEEILHDFDLPFILMGPTMSPGSKHRIDSLSGLPGLAGRYNPVIVVEDVRWEKLIRLVCINLECVAAAEIGHCEASFGEGSPISLDEPSLLSIVPSTHQLIRMAHLDDVAVTWGFGDGRWMLVEITSPPLSWKTPAGAVHRFDYLCKIISSGFLR